MPAWCPAPGHPRVLVLFHQDLLSTPPGWSGEAQWRPTGREVRAASLPGRLLLLPTAPLKNPQGTRQLPPFSDRKLRLREVKWLLEVPSGSKWTTMDKGKVEEGCAEGLPSRVALAPPGQPGIRLLPSCSDPASQWGGLPGQPGRTRHHPAWQPPSHWVTALFFFSLLYFGAFYNILDQESFLFSLLHILALVSTDDCQTREREQ